MSYQLAKDLLSATEKERLVCIALHSSTSNVDWETASKEFGSASVRSFKMGHYNTMKKLSEADGQNGSPKRKADGEAPEDDPQTPKKTPRGRPKKQNTTLQNKTSNGNHYETPIKDEPEHGI